MGNNLGRSTFSGPVSEDMRLATPFLALPGSKTMGSINLMLTACAMVTFVYMAEVHRDSNDIAYLMSFIGVVASTFFLILHKEQRT